MNNLAVFHVSLRLRAVSAKKLYMAFRRRSAVVVAVPWRPRRRLVLVNAQQGT